MERGSGLLVPPADHDAARMRSQVDSAALFRVILAELARAIPKRFGQSQTLWNAYAREALSSQRSIRMRTIRPGLSAEVNIVMNSIIYLVGLIVVVMFILGALGLH
jgi:hypothetical protein